MGNVLQHLVGIAVDDGHVAAVLVGDIHFVVEQVHINAVGKLSSRNLGNVLVRSSVRHHQRSSVLGNVNVVQPEIRCDFLHAEIFRDGCKQSIGAAIKGQGVSRKASAYHVDAVGLGIYCDPGRLGKESGTSVTTVLVFPSMTMYCPLSASEA